MKNDARKMALENQIELAQQNAIDFTHACMTIALHDVFGVGKDRLDKVTQRKDDLVKHLDGIGDTGFEHIIGVHQQCTVVRVNLCVGFKRLIFAVEHLHPAVRHGADCRYAVIAVGDGTGGRAAAADVGRKIAAS